MQISAEVLEELASLFFKSHWKPRKQISVIIFQETLDYKTALLLTIGQKKKDADQGLFTTYYKTHKTELQTIISGAR